jgi:branched-chain amino acid aminotransferase
MSAAVVSIDGELRPAGGPHVSALDRGLLLADGLFETMRGRNGRIFRREQHLARLAAGLAALGMPRPAGLDSWLAAALAAAGSPHVRIRVTITRGLGPPGLTPPADARPTTIVALWPMADAAASADAVSLHVASGRRNQRAATAGVKTLAYTDAVMAMLEAQRHGADDALFLDTDDHCSEATGSNLFACRDGAVWTPPASCGALPGITRAVVIELAGDLGVPCVERAFGLDELSRAGEAFLTNSTRGLVPVARIGGRAIGGRVPGELTRRLADAYVALVRRECP